MGAVLALASAVYYPPRGPRVNRKLEGGVGFEPTSILIPAPKGSGSPGGDTLLHSHCPDFTLGVRRYGKLLRTKRYEQEAGGEATIVFWRHGLFVWHLPVFSSRWMGFTPT